MRRQCALGSDELRRFFATIVAPGSEIKHGTPGLAFSIVNQPAPDQVFKTLVKKITISAPFERLNRNIQTNFNAGYIFPEEWLRLNTIVDESEDQFCRLVESVFKRGEYREKSSGKVRRLETSRDWADLVIELFDLIAKMDDQVRNALLRAISREGISETLRRCEAGYPKKDECFAPCERGFFRRCTYKKLDPSQPPTCFFQQQNLPFRLP